MVFTLDLQHKFWDFVDENKHITQDAKDEFISLAMEHFNSVDYDNGEIPSESGLGEGVEIPALSAEAMNKLVSLEIELDQFIKEQGIIVDISNLEELRARALSTAAANVQAFINFVTSFPLLTDAQAISLIENVKLDPTNEDAKNQLLFANAKSIVNYAITRCNRSPYYSLEDILMEGFFGIWQNIDKYDVTKGHFSAWACTAARHTMYQYTTESANLIITPEYIRRRRDYIAKVANQESLNGSVLSTFGARCAVVSEELRATNTAKAKSGLAQNLKIDYKDIMTIIRWADAGKDTPTLNNGQANSQYVPGAENHDNIHSINSLAVTEGEKDLKKKDIDKFAEQRLKDFIFNNHQTGNDIRVYDDKNPNGRDLTLKDLRTIFMIFDGFTTKECESLISGTQMIGIDDTVKTQQGDGKDRTVAEMIPDPQAESFVSNIEAVDNLTKAKQMLLAKVNTLSDKQLSKSSLSDKTIGMLLYGLYTNKEFEQLTGIEVDAQGVPVPNALYTRRETEFLLRKFVELWNKNTKTSLSDLRVSLSSPAEVKKYAELPIWSIKHEVETKLTPAQRQKFEAEIGGDKTNMYSTLQLSWYRHMYTAKVGYGKKLEDIQASKAKAAGILDDLRQKFTKYGLSTPPDKDFLGALIFLDNDSQERVLDALSETSLEQLKTLPFYNHRYTALNPEKIVEGYDPRLMTYEEIAVFTGASPSQLTNKIKNIKEMIEDNRGDFSKYLE